MISADDGDGGDVVALGPLRWYLVKIKREWDDRITNLEQESVAKTFEMEREHREQRRALTQHLRTLREAEKANTPLNGRLTTMKASRDNLVRLGRLSEAEKVRQKLEPLEKGYWAKILAASGFAKKAKREQDRLLAAQQAELGAVRQALRRDTGCARKARDAEVRAQQRKTRRSSDNVWSIWSAAKSGETERLRSMLALPHADVDVRDPDSGWTSLHFASRQGRLGAVETLVESHAFVGARGPDGRTPLHLAAGWGTHKVCVALLHAGADKNAADRHNQTPQQLAESRQRGTIVKLLSDWRPIGLTATQKHRIVHSRPEGSVSSWETEANPNIRAQLRVLEMKMATLGERHEGTRTTLGKLGGLFREAGRLKDAKHYLQQLVDLLQSSIPRGSSRALQREGCSLAPPGNSVALAVALGNLGVVCHELGEADQTSELLEASLEIATSGAVDSERHLIETATRNLGLYYLSEGRVDKARSLFLTSLEMVEEDLRPDMTGGDESVDLIPPLTLLSYAAMLAGDHTAAETCARRAQTIAAKRRRHGDLVELALPTRVANDVVEELSDPIPRLEWLGVQQFVAGKHASAAKYFARARALVPQRLEEQCGNDLGTRRSKTDGFSGDGGSEQVPCASGDARGRGRGIVGRAVLAKNPPGEGCGAASSGGDGGESTDSDVRAAGEFEADAMRLDRCMAVAICRQGPEAF